MTAPFDARSVLEGLFKRLAVDSSRRTFASTANLRAVMSPQRREGRTWMSLHIHPEHRDVPWPLPSCTVRIEGSGVTGEIGESGRVLLGPLAEGRYRLRVEPPATMSITSRDLSLRLGATLKGRLQGRWAPAPRRPSGDVSQERLAAAGPEPEVPRISPIEDVSDDGTVRIRILQDEDGRIVVRLATDNLTLEGYAARVSVAGAWGDCVLERVAVDQLLGEVVFTGDSLFQDTSQPPSIRVVLTKGSGA
jgi:hypothetical protein